MERNTSTRAAAIAALTVAIASACSHDDPTPGTSPASPSGGTAGGTQLPNGGSNTGSTAGGGGRSNATGGNGGSLTGGGGASSHPDATAPVDATVPANDARPPGAPYVYVSGYGADISLYSLDEATGKLASRGKTSGGTSPSYLAFAPDQRHLYAVNEGNPPDSRVVAFSVSLADGHLTEIDRQETGGSGAPHLAVHPSGKWVAVAHYGSGHTSVLPILPDGTLDPLTDIKKGPSDGCDKAHEAVFDRSGAHLLVPCLGSNYVIQYGFADGKLSLGAKPTAAVPGGPRHVALDPTEHHAYVISELESLLTSFDYDASTGTLSNPQTINSFETTKGASAHVVVHPSGRFLYVSNRTENSLGLFSIDAQGRPHPVSFEKADISTPRDFSVDATGRFLVLANQEGAQTALVYRIGTSGALSRTDTVNVGESPTFTGTVYLAP